MQNSFSFDLIIFDFRQLVRIDTKLEICEILTFNTIN